MKYKLFKPYYSIEMGIEADKILKSGNIATGNAIDDFESNFASLLGLNNVLSLCNMTSALYMALYLAGVKAGDEVLTTSFSCMSTNAAIDNIGAKAVWVDLCDNSPTMNPLLVEKMINKKTKALILYHTAGYPAKTRLIEQICKKNGIKLIEDCNNALLSFSDGQKCGSTGDYAVFSFYPNRYINGIEGAALYIKNSDEYERAKKLRRFGVDYNNFRDSHGEINPLSDINEIGWSMGMPNLNCAIANIQLKSLHERISTVKNNSMLMASLINKKNFLEITLPNSNDELVPWVFFIQTKNQNEILIKLKERGIGASKLHYNNHNYKAFEANIDDLINTIKFNNTAIALPIGWWLDELDITAIVDILEDIVTKIN